MRYFLVSAVTTGVAISEKAEILMTLIGKRACQQQSKYIFFGWWGVRPS